MRLHHLARVTMIVRDLEVAIAQYRGDASGAHFTQFYIPDARALDLGSSAIAAARAATIVQSGMTELELIEQRDAQLASDHRGWVGVEFAQDSATVRLNCLDCAVSAAFYLGLGADDVHAADAQTRVIQLNHSALRFESEKAELPAMDLANLRLGILSVQIARIGTRGQAGPLRVLRGPDAELIELV